jgi:CDGSH-type Zn-finger protein
MLADLYYIISIIFVFMARPVKKRKERGQGIMSIKVGNETRWVCRCGLSSRHLSLMILTK